MDQVISAPWGWARFVGEWETRSLHGEDLLDFTHIMAMTDKDDSSHEQVNAEDELQLLYAGKGSLTTALSVRGHGAVALPVWIL